MPEETLLAFDFGEKKIGVAIGNTLTRHARPLEIIHGECATRASRASRHCCANGSRSAWSAWRDRRRRRAARHRALPPLRQPLNGRFGMAVELVDERGSSMEAQRLLGTHAADDAMAAAVILQRYLTPCLA